MFQFIFKQKCKAKLCFYLLFPKDKDKGCSKNNGIAKGNQICHRQHHNMRKSKPGDLEQKLFSVVVTVDTVTIFILIWSQLLKFFMIYHSPHPSYISVGFSDIFVRGKLSKARNSLIGRWLYSGSWVMLRALFWSDGGDLCSKELFRNLCWHITLHPQVNFKHTHAVSKHSRNYLQHHHSSVPIHHNCPPVLRSAHIRTGPSILCPSILSLCREKCSTQKNS